ncbi:MAG: biotin--[acetyl-CoA-carboxylase] ligase [Nitrososphaeraceae archaeon]
MISFKQNTSIVLIDIRSVNSTSLAGLITSFTWRMIKLYFLLTLLAQLPLAAFYLKELIHSPSAQINTPFIMRGNGYLLNYFATTKKNYTCNRVFFYDTVESTQDIAVFLSETNLELDKTLIIATEQRGGKGRNGKKWLSPQGGIWLSLIMRPKITLNKSFFMSFVASLSVCEAIRVETGLESKVKWPNDIVIQSKKVSGILISIGAEGMTLKYLIVGIGINANLDDTSLKFIGKSVGDTYQVGSLKNEMLGKDIDCGKLVARILQKLDYYYDELEHRESFILSEWKKRCETINKHVLIINKDNTWYEAYVSDIDFDGSLVVITANGRQIRVTDNQVTIRMMS